MGKHNRELRSQTLQDIPVKKTLLIPLLGTAMVAWLPMTVAREVVVLPGVVNPVGVASGVDTQGPGLLTVGAQDINTGNDPGGAITTNAANTASILFNNSSTVTGFVGTTGSTFLNISAGANARHGYLQRPGLRDDVLGSRHRHRQFQRRLYQQHRIDDGFCR